MKEPALRTIPALTLLALWLAGGAAQAGRDLETLLLKVETNYLDREIQANNRLLQDPKTLVDAALTKQVEIRQNELIGRLRSLSQRRRTPR